MLQNTSNNQKYRGELLPLPDLPQLEIDWRALEAEATCSFFLSWSWIGAWLSIVQHNADLKLYRCYCNEELIAMAIVSSNKIKRRSLFQSQILTLNEVTGGWNMFIEYNGILAKQGHETAVWGRLLDDIHSADNHWDEIQITNVPQERYAHLRHQHLELSAHDEISHTLWIAPLNVDTTLDSITAPMSKNRRWQIRRTFKEYEKEAPLNISAARNADEALDYFQQMGVLHTQRWQRVGVDGAFSRPQWVNFHQNLIRSAFDRGEIQLLRIDCGSRPIGYLYNFLWQGTVHMLQSGFATEQSNTLRPGYVSHILAMQLNAQLGAKQYDFMIGDSEYKKTLAQPHPPLMSVRLQKPRLKFLIENSVVTLYRALRKRNLTSFSQFTRTTIEHSAQGLLVALNLNPIIGQLSLSDMLQLRILV